MAQITQQPRSDAETAPLLGPRSDSSNGSERRGDLDAEEKKSAWAFDVAVLPLALLCALAMASTAATSFYTFAILLCKDPQHCKDGEKNAYSGGVAVSTTIANVLGLVVLGPLERLSEHRRKGALGLWIVVRSLSVVMLVLGLYIKNPVVALSSRIFQGLASDNLLHFSLNTIYALGSNKRRTSRLIGASLSLFMIGISVAPFLASLFSNFQVSFAMSGIFFAASLLYLAFLRSPTGLQASYHRTNANSQTKPSFVHRVRRLTVRVLRDAAKTLLRPLAMLRSSNTTLLAGMSLLFYNMVQSYVFSALLIYASTEFHFSSTDGGVLISVVHLVAATYLILSLVIIPWLRHKRDTPDPRPNAPDNDDERENLISADIVDRPSSSQSKPMRSLDYRWILGTTSLILQGLALVVVAAASKRWQIYLSGCILAFGLASPSFVKSFVVGKLSEGPEAAKAIASLASCEAVGDLLAPLALGAVQTAFPGPGVFYVAAGLIVLSVIAFMGTAMT